MKKLSFLLGCMFYFVVGAFAQGTTCATAVVVTAGTAATPASYSAVAATGTGASGLHAAGSGGGATPTASRWYKYTPTISGSITISACGSTADTRLWVMTGTCAALTDVAGDDDNCGTPTDAIYQSTLTMPVTAGTAYYVEWDDTWDPAAFTWTLAFSSTPAYDAQLKTVSQEYTAIPRSQIGAMTLAGSVGNNGANALASAKLTTTIFSSTNTVVATYTSPTAALAAGATATFTSGTWTPPATAASYTIQYVLSHANSATDATPLNDTIRYPFNVTSDIMARDDNARFNGLGVTGTATAAVKVRQGQEFKVTTAGTLNSVDVQIGGGNVGDTIQVEIYTVTGGVVSATPVYTTPVQTLTAVGPGFINITLPTPLAVTAGTTYMVALMHSARGANIGLGYSTSIYTAAKTWIKTSATATWANPEVLNPIFKLAYMIRLHLPLPGPDAAMSGLAGQEYTIMPKTEVTAQTFGVTVRNKGTVAANTAVTVTITNTTTNAVVYTNTSASVSVPVNGSQNISCGTWTPPTTPNVFYDVKYVANVASDTDRSNDTLFYFISVSDTDYARDDANNVGGLGLRGSYVPRVTRIVQGTEFVFPNAARIDSVTALIGGGRVGDSIRAEIYLVTAGVVAATPVAFSNYNVLTDSTGGVKTLPLTTIFSVTPGATYMVALYHSAHGRNIALQYSSNIYTVAKNWLRANTINANAWAHPEALNTTLKIAYILRPNVICPIVTASIATPSAITCSAPTVTLTATGGASYAWSNSTATTATNAVTAAGTYTVTASTAAGCTATATVVVTANTTAPTATATKANNLTCTTPTTVLTATGGGTYAWSGGGTTATKTVTAAGTYTVTVTNTTNGCVSTSTVVVTANTTPPTATATKANDINCTNTSAVLTATGGGTYAWSGGGTTATKTVTAAGTYTVTVTNTANGCVSTSTVVVAANTTPPTAGATVSGALTCTNTSVTLTGLGGVSYAWSGTPTVTTATKVVTVAGTYTVTVTGANGCTAVTQATVGSNTTAPTVSIAPPASLSCTTTSVTLTASGNTTSFAWSTGVNTASTTVTAAGTYTVTATNLTTGCTSTATTVVSANASVPTVSVAGGTTLNCTTVSSTLTATSTATAFAWSTGATTAGITVTAAGTYTVTVTATSGCTAATSITVTSNTTAPTAAATSANNLTCATPTTVLTATGGGTYAWSGGGTTATKTVTAAGTYTVTVTGANGCTAIASVSVTANTTAPVATATTVSNLSCSTTITEVSATGGGTYAWSNGATTAITTVTAAATYTVTVTGANGCTATASTTVTIDNTPPTIAGTVVGSAGTNGSVTLTSPATGTFVWSNGATTSSITSLAPGTYTVTVTNAANGCSASSSFVVTLVGTQNLGNVTAFTAFPNPTNGMVNVNYTLLNTEKVNITIMNALGQVMQVKELAAAAQHTEQFDLTAYPAGTYFVQIQVGSTRLNERVVLQH